MNIFSPPCIVENVDSLHHNTNSIFPHAIESRIKIDAENCTAIALTH